MEGEAEERRHGGFLSELSPVRLSDRSFVDEVHLDAMAREDLGPVEPFRIRGLHDRHARELGDGDELPIGGIDLRVVAGKSIVTMLDLRIRAEIGSQLLVPRPARVMHVPGEQVREIRLAAPCHLMEVLGDDLAAGIDRDGNPVLEDLHDDVLARLDELRRMLILELQDQRDIGVHDPDHGCSRAARRRSRAARVCAIRSPDWSPKKSCGQFRTSRTHRPAAVRCSTRSSPPG